MSMHGIQRNPPRLVAYCPKKKGPLGHLNPNLNPYFTIDSLGHENVNHLKNRFPCHF